MNQEIKRIIIENAGVLTSNGEYIRNEENPTIFNGPNGNQLELTVDGWYLVDAIVNDQTYWISEDFDKIGGAGDNIMPIPSFETFNE